ncbi:MAG: hypothetical protein KM312_07525 [Hydrogenibacillus schlegelii]|uniref:Diacylglycerol glucosyltransferase N-terminal domain-containing protein n=1 Tax=Hydrogenibacillus schlegelii TaxID=1484 RepID=A0A947GA72_HYDSH|nr:hypothetical protein [Hydrogenibacillus schlegelii]
MDAASGSPILIVTGGFGDGHRRAAEALALAVRDLDAGRPVHVVDLYAALSPKLYPLMLQGYRLTLSRAPELLGGTYRLTARLRAGRNKPAEVFPGFFRFPPISLRRGPLILLPRLRVPRPEFSFPERLRLGRSAPLGRPAPFRPPRVLAGHVLHLLEAMRPAAVAITAPVPAVFLARVKRRAGLAVPLAYVATDLLPHPAVAEPEIDRFLVAHGRARAHLAALGLPEERIRVTGIPVHPAFPAAAEVRTRRLQEEDAGAGKPLRIVVAGGGFGMAEGAKRLLEPLADGGRTLPPLRIAVLAGRNVGLRKTLGDLRLPPPHRLAVLPYLSPPQVAALYAAADGLVTKPGGLTVAEALTVGVPLFLFDPLPGPEEENARFLLDEGLAASGGADAFFRWVGTVADPTTRMALSLRLRSALPPNAAEAAAREILHLAGAR